jgi:rhodanese-related sulfurtransferase
VNESERGRNALALSRRPDGEGDDVVSAVDVFVDRARARISLVDISQAAQLRMSGALLIDIRPDSQRRQFGQIPNALTIERNVLEWRLEPGGGHRHPAVVEHDGPIIVFCQEGYASSLAVASLGDLGVREVHDLTGGFRAWKEAGLPTEHQAELPSVNS